jgi:hypothetical protein
MLRERFSPSALTRLLNIPANGRFINTADVGMPDHEGQKLAEDRHPHFVVGTESLEWLLPGGMHIKVMGSA